MSPKGRAAGAGASHHFEVRAPLQRHRLRHAQPRRGVGQRPKSIPPIRQKFAQRILITTLGDETEVRAPQRHRLRHAQPRRGVGQRPKSIPPDPPEIRAANSNKRAGARAIDHPCDEPKWPSRWGRRESTLQSSSVAETISFQHSGSSQFRKPLQPWINFKMTNPRSFAFPSISESPSDPNRSSLLG